MRSADEDIAIRIAAIGHVEALAQASPDGTLAWSQIEAGFEFRGETLCLANRTRGIFWPARLRSGALSIKTVVPREGRVARYDDAQLSHVVGDEPARLTFRIAPVSASAFADDPILRQAPIIRFDRDYSIAAVRRRLHQGRFRAAVLDAYAERCAICHLRRACLLDAAHIIPDREQLGEAMVPNGLSLCKLHHAAFDSHLVGITPDLEVRVSQVLLEERDGPMLEHGIRGFHGKRIVEPSAAVHRPDRELVALRWERFLRAGQ